MAARASARERKRAALAKRAAAGKRAAVDKRATAVESKAPIRTPTVGEAQPTSPTKPKRAPRAGARPAPAGT